MAVNSIFTTPGYDRIFYGLHRSDSEVSRDDDGYTPRHEDELSEVFDEDYLDGFMILVCQI